MPSVRLTDRWLRAKRPGSREEWTDAMQPGLIVRFGSRGAVFYARLRVEGKYARHRIGAYPAVRLEEAREAAREFIRARETGRATGSESSFAALCSLYVRQHARPNKRTAAADEAIINRDLLPEFGRRVAGEIRPREIARFLDRIVERGAPVQANRVRSLLSKIFAFGLAREIVESNPAAVTERPTKEAARDLYLSDAQIVTLWNLLEFRHPTLRNMIRFMLLTGQRVSEVRELPWGEISGDLWELPAARSKNARPNLVPLSAAALSVLSDQSRLGLGGNLVFPSPRSNSAPWDLNSVSHAVRKMRSELGCDWQPKDLRRTAATLMSRLGHSLAVGKVLNHTDPSVTSAHYDRYAFLVEKRAALDALGSHVQALLASGQSRSPATQARTSDRRQPTE